LNKKNANKQSFYLNTVDNIKGSAIDWYLFFSAKAGIAAVMQVLKTRATTGNFIPQRHMLLKQVFISSKI
jgi:hypothetical protein